MRTLFEALFGSTSQNTTATDLFDSQTQNSINQSFNSAYNQYTQNQLANTYAQQQLAGYNAAIQAGLRNAPPNFTWVYNGEACDTIEEFAKLMFPEDPESQLMFVLKHGGANGKTST